MYRYASSSKQSVYRSDYPLSIDAIAQYAPSVLASQPHESRSQHYTFLPTSTVLEGLGTEGFVPYEVRQTKVRDVGRREHTRHLVRLRYEGLTARGSEIAPEIILINAHDGTSAYRLIAGFFRFVCSNGLIAGDVCEDVSVRHSGDTVGKTIEGAYRVVETLREATGRIDHYRDTHLPRPAQLQFAEQALRLRWPEQAPVEAEALLEPRRYEDAGADLWRVFNRVQEALLRGGLSGRSQSGRRLRTRAVTGLTEDVRINRGLWDLADAFAA